MLCSSCAFLLLRSESQGFRWGRSRLSPGQGWITPWTSRQLIVVSPRDPNKDSHSQRSGDNWVSDGPWVMFSATWEEAVVPWLPGSDRPHCTSTQMHHVSTLWARGGSSWLARTKALPKPFHIWQGLQGLYLILWKGKHRIACFWCCYYY